MNHIVKRRQHNEPYDGRKLYASIYAACLVLRTSTGSAELVASAVVKDVEHWLSHKHEVTSNDLRTQAGKHLKAYHPDAAYMYLNHRTVS